MQLSDRDLLDATTRAAGDERRATIELLALLGELDARKLYLGESYSSLFMYCTRRLRLSEPEAYSRITAARVARRFPILLERLADGDLTLTSIVLLAAHLTEDNYESLIESARHATKRDVERLVAGLHPQPDIPTSVRRGATESRPVAAGLGAATEDRRTPLESTVEGTIAVNAPWAPGLSADHAAPDASAQPRAPLPTPGRAAIAPIATDRYFLRVTIGVSTHDKLERARDLLRHSIPSGDVAAILDRALTTLVEQLERRKAGRTIQPKLDSRSSDGGHAEAPRARPRNRHIPTSVRRFVWTRDEGRCAFVGPHGRCGETGFLEYHHVVPFATGGASDDKNIELRCRAHNDYEATVFFSREVPDTDGVGAGAGSSMAVFDSA